MKIKIDWANYFNWQKFKYLFLILLFMALFYFEKKFHLKYFITLPALILVFYLPGYMLNHILGLDQNKLGKFFNFYLNIFTSLILVAVWQFFWVSRFALTQTGQVWLLLVINLILWLLYFFLASNKQPKFSRKISFSNLDYLIFTLPLLVFLITLLIDPFVENADNYLTSINNSILLGENIRGNYREFYVPLAAFWHFVTDLNLVWIYKIFISLIFYLSLGFLFDFVKQKIKDHKLGYLVYLLVVGASVIIVEINIVRPQVFLLAYILPILFLNFYSLRDKNYKFVLLALFLSLGVSGFHPIGLLFALISFISLLILIYHFIFITETIKITLKNLVRWLLVVIPYIYILEPAKFISSFRPTIRLALRQFEGFNWQWWFIDSYKTIDGYQLGWPGIWALCYYLYNGILLLILLIALIVLFRKQLKQISYILPAIILVAIFFIFAEVLPRMGYFFLPNRAWPFLMIGLVMMLAWMFSQIKIRSQKIYQLIIISLILINLSGFGATLYLTRNTIGEIRREEMAAIKFVNNEIPDKSVIITSQDNEDLFNFYSNKKIAKVRWDPEKQIKINKKILYQTVLGFDKAKFFAPIKLTLPEIRQSIFVYQDNKLISEKEVVTKKGKEVVLDQPFNRDAARYFFYSLAKNKGLATMREYKKNHYNDTINNEFFKNYSGDDVVYNDGQVIIIKIK